MIHPNNEWSLIIFNILGQMSVGAFLAFGVVHFFAARRAGIYQANLLATRALLALGPILVIGMAAVFTHVGNPDRVFNMLSNLDTSWLAREVAAYGAFLVVGGAFAILQGLTLFKKDEELPLSAWLPKIRIALAWIAAIFGVLFVLSAAMIYFDPRLATRQSGWAHIHTVIIFFVDMAMLGALALSVGFVANYLWLQRSKSVKPETRQIQLELLRDSIKAMSFVAIAAIGVLFVSTPIYLVYLGTKGDPLTSNILMMLSTEFAPHFFAYLFLSFTGAGILSAFSWYAATENTERQSLLYLLVVGAFICTIVAAVIGRYLFYARNATLLIGGP